MHAWTDVCVYVRAYEKCIYVHTLYVCMYGCMHACMHVCMYVCMYGWMHACMHACMHVCMCTYACMHACMYVCMYVCLYVFVCVCMCLYVFVCVCMCLYVFVCVCMCLYMFVCFGMCMYVCVYVCIYVCMYICMYACMYVRMWRLYAVIFSRKLRQTRLDTQQAYKACKINTEGKLTCHWHGPVCKPVRRSREHFMILCNLQNPSEIEHNKPMLNTTNYINNSNIESWRISHTQPPAKPIFLSKARGALN